MKRKWDGFVIVLAVYNSFQIPFNQAFVPYFFETSFFNFVDLIIDTVFLIDIILMFFTSILSDRGK